MLLKARRFLFNIGIVVLVYILFTTPKINNFKSLSSSCTPIKNHPSIQYSIVIDCGSTGSRIHIYKFNYCQLLPKLEDEVFVHKTPGLSSFQPQEAADSLDSLMEIALENVPKELYKCTQISLRATAGLRMLKDDLSTRIMEQVYQKLKSYPFPIYKNKVEIMSGSNEGILAWITTNYLLNNIGQEEKVKTVGILDLGGGSTQIVFEPTEYFKDGGHKQVIEFGLHSYELYQHSYDGYGLMEGRQRIKESSNNGECELKSSVKYKDQVTEQVYVDASISSSLQPGLLKCQKLIQKTLFQKHTCDSSPCSFDNVFMPPIESVFQKEEIYAFSYFYDKYAEPFSIDNFSLARMRGHADKVCGSNVDAIVQDIEDNLEQSRNGALVLKEFNKNKEWCADLSFMYTLLKDGYGIHDDRIIKSKKKIEGIEIGWTLGLAIQMLDDQQKDKAFDHCKA